MSDDIEPTRVVLIRHGESQVTVRRVVGGPRTCTGLSALGRQQADRLRARIAETGELEASVLYASGYPRAIETAQIIAPALGFAADLDVDGGIDIDEGFGEHDPGPECDGLAFDEFIDRYGMPDWHGDPHGVTFPGGETVGEFHLRVGAALSAVVGLHAGGSIVVACHGGVVEAAFRYFLRIPPGPLHLHTRNTAITSFTRVPSGQWRLDRYNDAAHLVGLPDQTERGAGDQQAE
ncbi:MAG: histidine phosphatase family protein [Ilumatobacter sp.]|uniref:histidine phosphatase family protein n=1 Tax=Ilumatobacter sp. TaxID=1967498 RepID=UPI00263721CF|nr:histidine phosphatase family protein [Ilumatobacter sp.]MDJ0769736.1 histidine phosphatase family protein [Ilumatobacter sp.]